MDAEQKRRNQIAWQGAIGLMVQQPNQITGAEIARLAAARCTQAGFEVPSLRVMARFANATRQWRKTAGTDHPVAPLGCWGCLRARKKTAQPKALYADQGKDYSRKAAKR